MSADDKFRVLCDCAIKACHQARALPHPFVDDVVEKTGREISDVLLAMYEDGDRDLVLQAQVYAQMLGIVGAIEWMRDNSNQISPVHKTGLVLVLGYFWQQVALMRSDLGTS